MSSLVLEHAGDPKSLFKLIDSYLNKPMKNRLPEHTSNQQLAEDFNTYFNDKTLYIHINKFNINETEDIRNCKKKSIVLNKYQRNMCYPS